MSICDLRWRRMKASAPSSPLHYNLSLEPRTCIQSGNASFLLVCFGYISDPIFPFFFPNRVAPAVVRTVRALALSKSPLVPHSLQTWHCLSRSLFLWLAVEHTMPTLHPRQKQHWVKLRKAPQKIIWEDTRVQIHTRGCREDLIGVKSAFFYEVRLSTGIGDATRPEIESTNPSSGLGIWKRSVVRHEVILILVERWATFKRKYWIPTNEWLEGLDADCIWGRVLDSGSGVEHSVGKGACNVSWLGWS